MLYEHSSSKCEIICNQMNKNKVQTLLTRFKIFYILLVLQFSWLTYCSIPWSIDTPLPFFLMLLLSAARINLTCLNWNVLLAPAIFSTPLDFQSWLKRLAFYLRLSAWLLWLVVMWLLPFLLFWKKQTKKTKTLGMLNIYFVMDTIKRNR